MIVQKRKMRRAIKNKYAFGVYKPNKNCKPVTYNGTEYLSKAQCMVLEGITRKELDEYLNGGLGKINEAIDVHEEQLAAEVEKVKEVEERLPLNQEAPDKMNFDEFL